MTSEAARRWSRWGGKAACAFLDQGLVSGANFALALLLSMWMAERAYGAFAVAWAALQLLMAVHNALLGEPMSVLGPARHRERLAPYVGCLLRAHAAFAVAASLLLAAAAEAARRAGSPTAGFLFGLAAAEPFVLLFWLLRRACYLEMRPERAMIGSALYAAVLVGGLALLRARNALEPISLFLVMAAAGLVGSLPVSRFLQAPATGAGAPSPAWREVAREHWDYGKWLIGVVVGYWLTGAVYAPLVAQVAGLEHAGVLRTLQNLVQPLLQGLGALGLLLQPWASRQRAERGPDYPIRMLPRILLIHLALAGPYVAALVLFGPALMRRLYAPGLYTDSVWLLPYVGAVALLGAAAGAAGVVLRAIERTREVFWCETGAVLLTLTVGIHGVNTQGVFGALLGMICSGVWEVAAVFYCVVRVARWMRSKSSA